MSDAENELAELRGRMQAIEAIAVTSLGLYLANNKNDPDFSKSRALLDFVRQVSYAKAGEMSPEAAASARHHTDDLLSQVLENLHLLHGGGGPPKP